MLLPDDLIIKKNCSKEMISLHNKTKAQLLQLKQYKKYSI